MSIPTMKNFKPCSILSSTLQCIAASVISGALGACALVVIVLLLSGSAVVFNGDGSAHSDMLHVERPVHVEHRYAQ